jgi:MFS family permease
LRTRRLLFEFFFLSGFCGLVDQVVWVRLAFASFGIITAVVSVVISVFMLGLALGAWIAGRAIEQRARRHSALMYYAAAEIVIGLGAFLVPSSSISRRACSRAPGPPTRSSTWRCPRLPSPRACCRGAWAWVRRFPS